MDDLIKRSDAIKAVLNMTMFEYRVPYDAVILTLQNLPSADRPSMEWKEDKDGQIRCTNCGRVAEWNFFEDEYCPRCGAKRED